MKILRELRLQRGITLKTLARAVGLTPGYLSQLERARVSPSMETLTRLANYYKVPVAFFFEEDVDGVAVIRQGSHLVLQPEEKGARFQLLSPDLNRRIEFLLITIDPGMATHSDLNRHPGEEVHFVLQGTLEAEVGGRTFVLETGDSMHFQSMIPHRLRNPKSEQAVVVTAMTPPTRWSKAMVAGHGGRAIPAPPMVSRAVVGKARGAILAEGPATETKSEVDPTGPTPSATGGGDSRTKRTRRGRR